MTIFHISGNQGSGKNTLGIKLKSILGNKVIINDFIKSHRNKNIIFTGFRG